MSQNILRTFKLTKPFKNWINVDGRRLSDMASAIMLEKTEEDFEPEDRFGYTFDKIERKYTDLEGQLRIVYVNKTDNQIGLGLAGNKDRSKLSIFIIGIAPNSAAAQCGDEIQIGDQLLEVNGVCLYGRSHLIASCVLSSLSDGVIKLIFLRNQDSLNQIAVKPQLPVNQQDVVPEDQQNCDELIEENFVPLISSESFSKKSAIDSSSVAPASLPLTSRRVKIRKGNNGFGITLTKGKTEDAQGYFVTHVSPNSPASQEKFIKIGDQVLAIDSQELTDEIYSKISDIIKCNEEIELTLKACSLVPSPRSVFPNNNKTPFSYNSEDPTEIKPDNQPLVNLRLAQIVPDSPCLIEIDKGGKGLGLSIVGGSDTVLGSVFVHEVYPDGSAAKDGRLQSWDQILEVQDKSLVDVAHHTAIHILRQAPSAVKLLIYRNSNFKNSMSESNQIYDVFTTDLVKKPGRGLGLNVVGRKEEPGIFVSEVVKNSVADVDGRIRPGDQILGVNGQNLMSTIHEQAASILKSCTGKVTLKIGRWKFDGEIPFASFNNHSVTKTFPTNSLHSSENNLLKTSISLDAEKTLTKSTSFHFPPSTAMSLDKDNVVSSRTSLIFSSQEILQKSPKFFKRLTTATTPQDGSQTLNEDVFEDDEIITVEVVKIANQPLGFGIGTRPRGVLITCVTPDTPVYNKLKVGDKVIAVNGRSIVDQQSAVQMIKNSGASIVFTLARLKTETT